MSFESFEKLPAERRERILATGIRAFSLRPYQEVSTESVTKECAISKGLLFHYFGSKKGFYLCCLEKALSRLTGKTQAAEGNDFYEILFNSMERKIDLCTRCLDETRMVNMASRDDCAEIVGPKAEVFRRYMAIVHAESVQTLHNAMAVLALKAPENKPIASEGLRIYVNALTDRFLREYQQTPDRFFENRAAIRREMKEYLDLFLYGICG